MPLTTRTHHGSLTLIIPPPPRLAPLSTTSRIAQPTPYIDIFTLYTLPINIVHNPHLDIHTSFGALPSLLPTLSPVPPSSTRPPRDAGSAQARTMAMSQEELQAQLVDLLASGHLNAEIPDLQPLQRAAITRQLYATILSQPEWVAAFLPDGAGQDIPALSSTSGSSSSTAPPLPSWDNLDEWLVPGGEGFGPERAWSLLDTQRGFEERNRKAGRPARKSKPGSVCGKVLQRYDRTYICK